MSAQVNAVLVCYGPRTTALALNPQVNKVQEFTLINDEWIVSHDHLVVKNDKARIFSPGNSRCACENKEYALVIDDWIKRAMTLRYTGGLILDVAQILIKRQGIFVCVGSKSYKAKLRALYEVGAMVFLIEKAGGKSIMDGRKSAMEF